MKGNKRLEIQSAKRSYKTPKLFIGMEETNIDEFESRCCNFPLSIEPLCRVACGNCGKSVRFPRYVGKPKQLS
jgi:hypothetical protein